MKLFMKNRTVAALLALTALVAMLTLGTHALFTASEANPGNDVDTGELTAPVLDAPTPSGGSVPLNWTAATLPGNSSLESEITYSVERKLGSGSFGAAGGTCTGSLSTTSCTDSVSASGIYTYRVVAKFRTWTATSNERVVSVTVGAAPDAPTTVALANGGGVGNAYINAANEASLSVDVGLPSSSVATDTVHVTITDSTSTTTDKTTAASAGAGTVTVTGIDATGLNDGSVTIRAHSSNASGDSSQTTTSVTKDTVKPSSSAGTVANITSGNTFTVPYTASDASPSSTLDKVELYVDPPGAGGFALAETDSTPSASGESFTYDDATADGEYGFYTRAYDKAGNAEDAPGAADATATRTSASPFRMATGSYVGNGVDGRAIAALGFQPDVVIVKGNASSNSIAVLRSSSMTGDAAKPLSGATSLTANLIESLTSSGFTVGTDARVNSNGTSYYWTAFKAGAGALKVGSYTGDGAATKAIAGTGFEPEYVAVLSAGGQRAVQRFSGMSRSFQFDADIGSTSRIASLDTDGFTIANSSEVNQNNTTYHYIAFNEVAGAIDVGSYQNSNANGRSITGVGFQPDYVAVRSGNTTNGREGNHRPASLSGSGSLRYAAGANITNGIVALESDGFRVSDSNTVQEANQPYFYIAFKNTAGGCSVAPSHILSATADSWVDQSSASSNKGDDSNLKVTSKSSNSNTRSLVRFDYAQLPALPSGCSIVDATLRLRNKSPVSGRTIDAYQADGSWTESAVNWNNQPATTGTAVGAVTPSSAAFMNWSVTSLVESMLAGSNDGFLVRDRTENDSGGKEQQFDSREASASDRPQLVVTYGSE